MLRVDFINVGDGDAALIRQGSGDGQKVLLVDCGRPHIEFVKGSMRAPLINYLMREGVEHIDLMALTHLHFDHIGGAFSVFRHMGVDKLTALYIPPEDARWIDPPDCGEKTVIGLCDALNFFNDITVCAKEKGCECEAARERTVQLGDMQISFILPDDGLKQRQKRVFDALYRGEYPTAEELYTASKDRNCSSIMLRIEYAGRIILITGDSYAEYWQSRAQRCDILKVPHHGDPKSMTEGLIEKLSPQYAVISCQNDTSSKKERPSEAAMEILLRHVPSVICTENKPLPIYPASAHDAVRFAVQDDGELIRL